MRKFLVILAAIILFPATTQASPVTPILTEVQAAGEDANQEFIELYNPSTSDYDVDGWELQYLDSGTGSSDWQTLVTFDNSIAPGKYVVAASGENLDIDADYNFSAQLKQNGSLRLYAPATDEFAESVYDQIGWGDNSQSETSPALSPEPFQSLKRFTDANDLFIDTNNNSNDFFLSDQPSPKMIDGHDGNESYLPLDLTELLPNPNGSQIGVEFVELYNPNSLPVNLAGYKLQMGTSHNYQVELAEHWLLPGQYYAVKDSPETNLILSNSGGMAQLLNPDDVIVSASDNYSASAPNETWSFIENKWQWSGKPTPGAVNELPPVTTTNPEESDLKPCRDDQFRNPLTNRCKLKDSDSGLKPCRDDQYRNPETNRCKLVASAESSLKPCAENQFRNPQTNRCKLVSSSSSGLKACAPDQFRNPETNRCKKNNNGSSLKPCNDNQERNPETNRCRLIQTARKNSTKSTGDEEAVLSNSDSQKNWPLVGVIAGGAVMYALYEFRYDARNIFQKARGYLGFRSSSGRDP